MPRSYVSTGRRRRGAATNVVPLLALRRLAVFTLGAAALVAALAAGAERQRGLPEATPLPAASALARAAT